MTFTRTIEDFVCEHCGAAVTGTGYTNHCPKCLWSKHVDVHPGDRKETCQGLMRPLRVEGSSPNYRLLQKCQKCSVARYITASPEDSIDALVSLAKSD